MSTPLKTVGTFSGIVIEDTSNGLFESTEKRTPGIRLILEVTEGPQMGEVIAWTGWLSENTSKPGAESAFERTTKLLNEVFGFNGNYLDVAENGNHFRDLPCSFVTEMEADLKDPNKSYLRVKWLNSPGGRHGNAPVLDSGAAKSLAQRMSARAQALLKSSGAVTTGNPAYTPNPENPY